MKIREGDYVVAEYRGHRFEGEAWEDLQGTLVVGATSVRYSDGTPNSAIKVLEVRPKPKPLPTETNSVIADVKLKDGREYPLAVLDGDGDWVVLDPRGDVYVEADEIVSFTKLVKEDA